MSAVFRIHHLACQWQLQLWAFLLVSTFIIPIHAFVSFPCGIASRHGRYDRHLTIFPDTQTTTILQVIRENADLTRTPKSSLTRPERKALERARKEKSLKKGKSRDPNSNALISSLSSQSTPDDIVRAINRARNTENRRLLQHVSTFLLGNRDFSFSNNERGGLVSRLAVSALRLGMNRIAADAIQVRQSEYAHFKSPEESASIIRGLLTAGNITSALEHLERDLPPPPMDANLTLPEYKDPLKHRVLTLVAIASRHLIHGELSSAVKACQMLTSLGSFVRQAKESPTYWGIPWLRFIQAAAKCETRRRNGDYLESETNSIAERVDVPCNMVYSVLNTMSTFPSETDDLVFEAISNSLVRKVVFVKGAVSMSGCPPPDRGEAVFIGRSNVGKSSLVNMITNRKSLAFTSKRPGKTQQYNYFAVNDKTDLEKEIKFGDNVQGERDADSFYMVDLPGFGYAKVPEKQREEWASFMVEYLAKRPNLKVVFHLIDGRHGPIDEDSTIMARIRKHLRKGVTYTVVLTKADKNVKGTTSENNAGTVSANIMKRVQDAMQENGVGDAPVLITSAETRLGRADLWRYLRLAAQDLRTPT